MATAQELMEQNPELSKAVTELEEQTLEEQVLAKLKEIEDILTKLDGESIDLSVFLEQIQSFSDEKKAELQALVDKLDNPLGEKTITLKTSAECMLLNSIVYQEVWEKDGVITKYGDFFTKGKGIPLMSQDSTAPFRVPLPSDVEFDMLASTYSAFYARPKEGNSLYVIGSGAGGQLGNGGTADIKEPYIKTFNSRVKKIITFSRDSSGSNGVGVLLENGDFYACGYNGTGFCGTGNTSQVNSFTRTQTGVRDIFGTVYNFLIVKDDGVYGAGDSYNGFLGVGSTGVKNTFTIVQGITNTTENIVMKASENGSGSWAGLSLAKDGNAFYGAGYNEYNQITQTDATDKNTFIKVMDADGVVDYSLSTYGFMFLKENAGNTEFWIGGKGTSGYGDDGVIGSNKALHKTKTFDGVGWKIVTNIRGLSLASSVFVVNEEKGEAWAFGDNGSGRLGVFDTAEHRAFKKVLLPKKNKKFECVYQCDTFSTSVSGGAVFNIDGEIYASGYETSGRLDKVTSYPNRQRR